MRHRLALTLLLLALLSTPLGARTLRVYVWTGPHGTEHFADRPPRRAESRVVRRLFRLPPAASPAALRRARRNERRAARFLARLARRWHRPSRPPSVPVTEASSRIYWQRPPLWYLPFDPYPGVLPLYPRPPAPPPPAAPPPDLAPAAGGFGICGYEIACPAPSPPPPVAAPPRPALSVPPPHPGD